LVVFFVLFMTLVVRCQTQPSQASKYKSLHPTSNQRALPTIQSTIHITFIPRFQKILSRSIQPKVPFVVLQTVNTSRLVECHHPSISTVVQGQTPRGLSKVVESWNRANLRHQGEAKIDLHRSLFFWPQIHLSSNLNNAAGIRKISFGSRRRLVLPIDVQICWRISDERRHSRPYGKLC